MQTPQLMMNTSVNQSLQQQPFSLSILDIEDYSQLVQIEIKKLKKKIPLIKTQDLISRELVRTSESFIEYLLQKLNLQDAEKILQAQLQMRNIRGQVTGFRDSMSFQDFYTKSPLKTPQKSPTQKNLRDNEVTIQDQILHREALSVPQLQFETPNLHSNTAEGTSQRTYQEVKQGLDHLNIDFKNTLTNDLKDLVKQMQDSQNQFSYALSNLYSSRMITKSENGEQFDSGYAEECKAQFQKQQLENKFRQNQENQIRNFENSMATRHREFLMSQEIIMKDVKQGLLQLEQIRNQIAMVSNDVKSVDIFLKGNLTKKTQHETLKEQLEMRALEFIQNTSGVGFMKKKNQYQLAQFESYMVAQIASDLLAVHNKMCQIDIVRFPQMTHVATISPEMRNCFSALQGKDTFYLGMVDGIAEYDIKSFRKLKFFNSKSYVYHIFSFDDDTLILCQKEGFLQILSKQDFSLLHDTQLIEKQSIGECKKTSKLNELVFATARGIIFAYLTKGYDMNSGISFNENVEEKYQISKGVDSVIEYEKNRLAICTNDGISLINREKREIQFFIQNPNKSTPRFIKEIPGLDMKSLPFILFRDEVNIYLVDLKNKRLHTILKILYTKNYLCKFQTVVANGPNQPLELVIMQYDDKDTTILHYVMKDQYHSALQILKDIKNEVQ